MPADERDTPAPDRFEQPAPDTRTGAERGGPTSPASADPGASGTATPGKASTSPFVPLKHPAFRMIWTATLVANLGTLIQNVGAGWQMALLTPSHDMVALVQASTTLPVMILAVAAGALADNFPRRRVMLAAQSFLLVISALLAVVAFLGLLTPWTLLAFTFLLGCGNAMHLPSWQASMRDLVPREDLPAAITLNSMSFNLMRSIGPAVGGLIVASAGPAAAFALNAVSYTAVIWALARWQSPQERRILPPERLGHAMAVGIRYVALSPNLSRVILRGLIFGTGSVASLALLPVITRDILGAEAETFGLMLGAFGLGAIAGALASPRLRAHLRIETLIAGAFAVNAVGLVIVAFSTARPLTILGLMLAGSAWVSALSLFNVSVQLATPRWVVGRALSIYQTATFGGMAIGSWIWGALAEDISIPTALLLAAALLLGGCLLGRVWPMPDFSDINLDPANRFSAPALRLDLKAQSGPIMIMVDWDIPPENTEAFLKAMAQRRRVRIRDGARQWSLLRDLENPDIWIETYHVPTWAEYIRHNIRRTQADVESFDQLLKLHRGPERPHVHRMIERQTVPVTDDIIIPPKVP
ncbi:MFS transporter [Falsirhodobacter sp. 20TX0035]|uniref:MFS transporter n=2 Tax=Pseudomonadota TaxID=1224 RepID=UPI00232BB033|nr:MFS transporter [Falsirhodobacter sp. 20TX0035]MDB6454667.1 MFS transporter [Falsirhodobacter sp. 20TX0035]